MNFQQAITEFYSRYADFSGRSTRPGYWWAYLWQLILIIPIAILLSTAGTIGVLLYIVFAVTHIIPLLSVTVRRLHDGGTSAWGLLIPFIPIVGGIVMIYLLIRPSEYSHNKWGPMIGRLD